MLPHCFILTQLFYSYIHTVLRYTMNNLGLVWIPVTFLWVKKQKKTKLPPKMKLAPRIELGTFWYRVGTSQMLYHWAIRAISWYAEKFLVIVFCNLVTFSNWAAETTRSPNAIWKIYGKLPTVQWNFSKRKLYHNSLISNIMAILRSLWLLYM